MFSIRNPDMELDLLCKARAEILEPVHWTQGCYARTIEGTACNPEAVNAVAWCGLGAILKHDGHSDLFLNVLDILDVLADGDFVRYQDSADVTHTDILQVFDDAIFALNLEATAPSRDDVRYGNYIAK